MSPKPLRWVGGVRCLELFPKKNRFFLDPFPNPGCQIGGYSTNKISVNEALKSRPYNVVFVYKLGWGGQGLRELIKKLILFLPFDHALVNHMRSILFQHCLG